MHIDDKLLSYLEDLSLLTLEDSEKKRLTGDLRDILDYMGRLRELNTDGASERSHPFDNTNAFRDDQTLPSFDRDLLLKNAPVKSDTMFIAPKTIESTTPP